MAAHWDAIAAADFFSARVLTVGGLVRYIVFFVVRLETRRVEIAGITCSPCGEWMKQIARNLTDCEDGFLLGLRHLILDRDPLYTAAFRRMLKDSCVKPVRLPAQNPNLNAYAERFVLSITSECLDRIAPIGERHVRRAVTEHAEHYHVERPHQGLGNRLIAPDPAEPSSAGDVKRRERLGGTLSFYCREAAQVGLGGQVVQGVGRRAVPELVFRSLLACASLARLSRARLVSSRSGFEGRTGAA